MSVTLIYVDVFQYMLLLRGATRGCCHFCAIQQFQYMLLLRGATTAAVTASGTNTVSIHAPLARSNGVLSWTNDGGKPFQYMLLLRGATDMNKNDGCVYYRFQYMLLLRGATTIAQYRAGHAAFQYMLLLRGATRACTARGSRTGFNTCSSCEEQQMHRTRTHDQCRFNTCSSCEEQRKPPASVFQRHRFNTCSSCEEQLGTVSASGSGFNTCSSCEEQPGSASLKSRMTRFQYMLLLRGATWNYLDSSERSKVSIHAPLSRSNEGGEILFFRAFVSIHAPLARSNDCPAVEHLVRMFQYMLLLRGATREWSGFRD